MSVLNKYLPILFSLFVFGFIFHSLCFRSIILIPPILTKHVLFLIDLSTQIIDNVLFFSSVIMIVFTVKVDFLDYQPTIQEGGLPGPHKLSGFHFHWGRNSGRGSEHTINGYKFAMEVSTSLQSWSLDQ